VKLTTANGILISSVRMIHKGKSKTLNGMIVDTGSAHTWINLDTVEDDLDIGPEEGDQIVTAFGIGGRDVANRKRIEQVEFENFIAEGFQVDFGRLGLDIDRLIVMDLREAGMCVT